MTFNTYLHLSIPLIVLTILTLSDHTHGFGARRNYHSYHHISQSSQGRAKSSSSSPGVSSIQDETERLLERAAHIREISAQCTGPICIRKKQF